MSQMEKIKTRIFINEKQEKILDWIEDREIDEKRKEKFTRHVKSVSRLLISLANVLIYLKEKITIFASYFKIVSRIEEFLMSKEERVDKAHEEYKRRNPNWAIPGGAIAMDNEYERKGIFQNNDTDDVYDN